MSNQFKRIQAAVVDGRAQTPRFIQKQLTKLHEALVKNSTALKKAIENDSGFSEAEAEIEYCVVLDAVRREFSSLDFAKALADEYSLADSKDNISKRAAYGCVYVIPSRQNPFYSTIVPLSAAIAAGNCVAVEIKQTLSELNTLLKQILTSTLDKDTFLIADSKPQDEAFLSRSCIILDGQPTENPVTSTRSIATPAYRTVAVVDRTARIAEAAREIARARFTFAGRSPYAPDLVLVNEFVLKEFCSAVTQCALSLFAEQIDLQQKTTNPRKAKGLKSGNAEDSLVTLVSGSKGSVVLARQREHKTLQSKISEPMLIIHPMSSLDDAIDTANSGSTPLLATYLFSAPPAAKYLSQFINAQLSCTNAIPADLLVGPPAPIGFTPTLQPRYTKEMFSHARPELVSFGSPSSKAISQILDKNEDFKARRDLVQSATTPLPSMNQPSGKQIGFFEQGLFTGSSILVSTLVATAVVSKVFLVPAVMRRLR